MNKYQKEYIYRINKVVDYIENNLDNDLSLEKLAEVANFSPYHFHRIFSVFMSETLSDFIKRIRVEKAASMLLTDQNRSISEVAAICGYNSLSVFCRNFKDRFKTSAQEFRNSWEIENSKNSQTNSKTDKLITTSSKYVCDVNSSKTRRFKMKKNVEIKEMPAMNVIYCRHVGQFNQIGKAYDKLFRWAGARGLLQFPETKGITYYHDDPKVTNIEKLRQSACITVKKDVKTEGEIGKMTIPGGKYFVSHFEINEMEFQDAWDSTCLWLSESGYQPTDESPYELYHNNHEEHPEKKFIVDICIPVKPL
ncbi:MAG: GyrI-like domain-containing protein [Bacteroidales bacterium]